jgi:glucoamylase
MPSIISSSRQVFVCLQDLQTAFQSSMNFFTRVFTLSVFVFLNSASAIEPFALQSAETWLQSEVLYSKQKLRESISPNGAAAGVVIASPQRANPNYFRHWVRDAALTMQVVVPLSQRASHRRERLQWEREIEYYVRFSRRNQLSATLTGLGEPIFEVDGTPFSGPWGRPQTDGPAIRAIALIQWANILIERGEIQKVQRELYDSVIPANTVIKADLEFVSHHWQDSSFDLWEEVKGDHFFTRMVQRKALSEGARLAERLEDRGAAAWYRQQVRNLDQALSRHWNSRGQWIRATLNRVEGVDYKASNLDSAVLLGILRAPHPDFAVGNQKVISTFFQLSDHFERLYSVNQRFADLAPALGRYPEDLYAGTDFDGGNPWVLTTLAAAEYCYKVSAESRTLQSQKEWLDRGDSFIQRVQFHAYGSGSLSEQIDRDTGFMTSAGDLTWNYAAIINAAWAREFAKQRAFNRKHKRKVL